MSTFLTKVGFKNAETLREFSNRFPNLPCCLDKNLEKIWICHKSLENIPQADDVVENQDDDFSSLLTLIRTSVSTTGEFDATFIFGSIYSHFGKNHTFYIFKKCFLFYNWSVSSFEPIIYHSQVQQSIEDGLKLKERKIPTLKRKGCNRENVFRTKICTSNKSEESDSSKQPSSNTASYRKFKRAFQNAKPYFELQKNPKDINQETFNLNTILYDINEKPKWPSNHILSICDADTLLSHIIQIPVILNIPVKKLLLESNKWIKLKHLLGVFINNHRKIEKNYGYGRILKGHFKKAKFYPTRRLTPVPKSIINSYTIDVIRKTIPLEFFGCNGIRKKFFTELVKVINGSKSENFLWFLVLQHLLQRKAQIPWCSQIDDSQNQNLVLLKLFKFIILKYVFIILKHNFYVTETGSSCYGLRFYRKSDVESVSYTFVNYLLYYKHLSRYRRHDFDVFTIERKWVDTGVIGVHNLGGDDKKFMKEDTEFKQPIAKIRFLPKNDFSDEIRIISFLPPRKSVCDEEHKDLVEAFEKRLLRRKEKLYIVKLFLEFLVEKMGTGIKPLPSNVLLEKAWEKATCLKENFGNVYFVKADIASAFDSVKHDVLTEILQKAIKEHTIRLKEITEWREVKGKMKKTTRLSFSDRPRENSILINRKEVNNSTYKCIQYLDIIKQVSMKQRLEIKGKLYKLVKGLAQGSVGKFSPQLCEIYYSSMDKLFFKKYINSKDCVVLRGVDDYLFITSEKKKAESFLNIIQSGIEKYNARFNKDKLKSNLLENITEVTYLGLVLNFGDMSVKPNYTSKVDIVSRMKLTDDSQSFHFNKQKFLHRRSLQLNSLKLPKIILNNKYNNIKMNRRIVYQASVYQSLRVMSLAKYMYRGGSKNERVVFKVLGKSLGRMRRLIRCLPEDETKWLFYSAMLSVFRKSSGQFGNLLVMIKFKLEVCENKFVESGFGWSLELLKNDLYESEFRNELQTIFGNYKTFLKR